MGAPGYTILCPEGHLIGGIESDLYWGEPDDENSVWKKLERLKNGECSLCGKRAMYTFYHYDYDIVNDCLHCLTLRYDNENQKWIIPENLTEEETKELTSHIILRK